MPDNPSKFHEIAVKLRFTPGALRAAIGAVLMIIGGLLTFWDRIESLIPVLLLAVVVNSLASTASPAAGPPLNCSVGYGYPSDGFAGVTIGTPRPGCVPTVAGIIGS